MTENKAAPHYAGEEIKKQTRYIDLYPGITDEAYRRFFKHVADIGSVEGAQKSVERIKQLYTYFETIGDRAGQHNAVVIALSAYHRAYFAGKRNIAIMYSNYITWLLTRSNTLAELGLDKATAPSRFNNAVLTNALQSFAPIVKDLDGSLKEEVQAGDMKTWLSLITTVSSWGMTDTGYAMRLAFEIGRRTGESNFYNETE